MLTLRFFDQYYEGKKRKVKVLAQIRLPDAVETFVLGRNDPMLGYTAFLNRNPKFRKFVDENHGIFQKEPKGYTYKDTSRSGTWLREKFWIFGERDARLEKNDPIEIKKGDRLVLKGGTDELVVEIVEIR